MKYLVLICILVLQVVLAQEENPPNWSSQGFDANPYLAISSGLVPVKNEEDINQMIDSDSIIDQLGDYWGLPDLTTTTEKALKNTNELILDYDTPADDGDDDENATKLNIDDFYSQFYS